VQDYFTIDLDHLRVLRELNERGTVTATAAALHLSPSAVSQQLRTLSRALGVPLTERDGRRLRLTPQAALVLQHAQAIGAQIERVKADLAAFNDGRAGTVTIGSFASVVQPLVIPALKALAGQRPQLEVAVTELEAPAAFAALDRGTIDVLITVDYVAGPTHGNPHYQRVDLIHDPLVIVVPNDHRLASSRRPLRLRQLAGERWVMGTVGHPCVDITIAAQSAAGFTANVIHRTDDWAATAAIVACGEAIALIPKLALMSIPRRGFTTRELAQPTARSIYAATRSGSTHAPHVAAVLSALGSAAETCL
jgi:DNA-binding transcriptional LysR family regulator